MTKENLTAVERLGMIVMGALVVIALPIMGILNTIGGSMSAMIAYTEGDSSGYALTQAGVPEAAEITATPLVSPTFRAWMLLLFILVLGGIAVYRLGTFDTPA